MRSTQPARVAQIQLPNNGLTIPSNDTVLNRETNIPTSRASGVQVG